MSDEAVLKYLTSVVLASDFQNRLEIASNPLCA